jgi:hypothetical protein
MELLSDYDRAFKGMSQAGDPLLTVVDNFRVFRGASVRSATPLYTISGNKLFKGLAVSGMPLATFVGDLIFHGNQVSGAPLARMKKTFSLKGTDTMGTPIVTVPSGNIATLFASTYHAIKG